MANNGLLVDVANHAEMSDLDQSLQLLRFGRRIKLWSNNRLAVCLDDHELPIEHSTITHCSPACHHTRVRNETLQCHPLLGFGLADAVASFVIARLLFHPFPRHYQLCIVALVEVSSLVDEDADDPVSRDPSEPPQHPKLRTRIIVSDQHENRRRTAER